MLGSSCSSFHDSYEEYADRDGHQHPNWGSCWINADGSTVWAHVRTPLPDDAEPKPDEAWLVLDTIDGRVLERASTNTAAAGSHHVSHPDPRQMGLSVGEGQDGVPLRWGRWDGARLTVTRIGDDDRCLVDVSPDETRFLTVAPEQGELAIHRRPDGAVTHEIDPRTTSPGAAGTGGGPLLGLPVRLRRRAHRDRQYRRERRRTRAPAALANRHDAGARARPGRVPDARNGGPTALGNSTWLTFGEDPLQLLLWAPR